ncbi:TIM44-like domain-containing protein [Ruminococcus sp.]|uniref:TIM44-like domain-containing protein n=1 Tax=Ruminococcus sp. TaxID=41978 RepID=UPI002BF0F41B|nr:TIM44-like domain-containing protein [Ruminococcus sp.]HNZ98093.1 TIM44-like domain-containing protein [Ruminococcus sp.]HOH85776.1 TIM44-like domain-containing protein [Ruminococcus sp.]
MALITFLLVLLAPVAFMVAIILALVKYMSSGPDSPYRAVGLNNNLNQFLVYDASFVPEEFLDFAREFYQEYRDCIQYKDMEKLRTMVSGALYTQLETQIDEFRRKGQTLHTGRIKYGDVIITGWRHERNRDVLPVSMKAEYCEFTTDDVTGEVVSGDKAVPEILELTLEFARASYTRSVDFLEKSR